MAELAFRATDLRRANGSVWSWIENGWVDDVPSRRGPGSRVRPLLDGRDEYPTWADKRIVEIRYQLQAATEADFLALALEMTALYDGVTWGNLVAADGYRGLGVGQTATLRCRSLNITPLSRPIGTHRIYSVELESVRTSAGTGTAPNWVIAP